MNKTIGAAIRLAYMCTDITSHCYESEYTHEEIKPHLPCLWCVNITCYEMVSSILCIHQLPPSYAVRSVLPLLPRRRERWKEWGGSCKRLWRRTMHSLPSTPPSGSALTLAPMHMSVHVILTGTINALCTHHALHIRTYIYTCTYIIFILHAAFMYRLRVLKCRKLWSSNLTGVNRCSVTHAWICAVLCLHHVHLHVWSTHVL